MHMKLTGLGAVLALAACSGGTEPEADAGNNAAQAAPVTEAQERVKSLPEGQRNAVLIRAIRDARQDCQHVESSSLSEASASVPVYLATCDDGAVYAVAIADDGNASVRPVMPAEQQPK